MNVVFRTDASFDIGTGHVMRCLTLAVALRHKGAAVSFVCREHDGNLCDLIARSRFEVEALPVASSALRGDAARSIGAEWQDDAAQTRAAIERKGGRADWLVVDHYALDARWEHELRGSATRILVIDDLADRPHDCDALLDQNFYDDPAGRYAGRVPAHCVKALGPQFALLRAEFFAARRAMRERDGRLGRVLVALGGADATNETGKVLQALCQPDLTELRIDVLVGSLNRHKQELLAGYGGVSRVRFHDSSSDVAALMAAADLSIGAGGTMNWERCFMGLPAVVLVIAPNQAETNDALHRAGAIVNLGWHADVTAARIADAVHRLAADPAELLALGERSFALMSSDGSNDSDLKVLKVLVGSSQ